MMACAAHAVVEGCILPHACVEGHRSVVCLPRSLVRVCSVLQLLVRPLQCAPAMPPRVLVPQLACCLVSSRCVSVCVTKMHRYAVREMDVVLAAMLVVCVRTVPSSRVRKIYYTCHVCIESVLFLAQPTTYILWHVCNLGSERSGVGPQVAIENVGSERSGVGPHVLLPTPPRRRGAPGGI